MSSKKVVSEYCKYLQQQCKKLEKHLNEQEHIEIIHKLRKPNPPSNSDNENNLEYIESIMEDVSDLVNSEAVQNANIGSSDDKTEASQMNKCILLDLIIFLKKFSSWRISLSSRSLKMERVRIMIR